MDKWIASVLLQFLEPKQKPIALFSKRDISVPQMDCKILVVASLLVVACFAYEPEFKPCACARIYRPLCASDGRTYSNDCELQCRAEFLRQRGQMLRVIYEGRCEDYY